MSSENADDTLFRLRRGFTRPLRQRTSANVLSDGHFFFGVSFTSTARSFLGAQCGRCFRSATISSSSSVRAPWESNEATRTVGERDLAPRRLLDEIAILQLVSVLAADAEAPALLREAVLATRNRFDEVLALLHE